MAPAVQVVAGVVRDAHGRILLAQRPAGRDWAGLWEFPGGKVEPGETPEAALQRELQEELGIGVQVAGRLIRVPQRYSDKRIVLDVFEAHTHQQPQSLDGQAFTWLSPSAMQARNMPPADRPVLGALHLAAHCILLPEEHAARPSQIPLGSEVLIAGTTSSDVAHAAGVWYFAAELQDANTVAALRVWQQQGRKTALVCEDMEALSLAEALGCTCAVLPNPVNGWQTVTQWREQVSLPVYIEAQASPEMMTQARWHGLQGVAQMAVTAG